MPEVFHAGSLRYLRTCFVYGDKVRYWQSRMPKSPLSALKESKLGLRQVRGEDCSMVFDGMSPLAVLRVVQCDSVASLPETMDVSTEDSVPETPFIEDMLASSLVFSGTGALLRTQDSY